MIDPSPPPIDRFAIVPVEALTDRAQRFKCVALRADMSAAACVDRSTAVHEGGRNQHTADPFKVPMYAGCAACPVGAEVKRRVGEKPLPKCVVCGVPVKGAKGRTPKCKDHRGTVPK